ncbi:MAG: GTA-gp10 family protein [Brevundimonas sp.]
MRGEVVVVLAGAERRLCLTLGALAEIETGLGLEGLTGLAEIETGLGLEGLTGLAERMRALSARDLIVVLGALLRGGGEAGLADELDRAGVGPGEAAEAVARAFAAAAG